MLVVRSKMLQPGTKEKNKDTNAQKRGSLYGEYRNLRVKHKTCQSFCCFNLKILHNAAL